MYISESEGFCALLKNKMRYDLGRLRMFKYPFMVVVSITQHFPFIT